VHDCLSEGVYQSRAVRVSVLACIDREGTLDAGLSKVEYADAVLIHYIVGALTSRGRQMPSLVQWLSLISYVEPVEHMGSVTVRLSGLPRN
jgi:hypothetical protein